MIEKSLLATELLPLILSV